MSLEKVEDRKDLYKMNKTRFYEILQANKNGEDLSKFIPTNPAEAALLANLTGGSGGGSTGGSVEVPSTVLNNPNIKNVYYGMCLNGKTKFTVNIKSMFNAFCIRLYGKTIEEMLVGDNADVYEFTNNVMKTSIPLLDIAVVYIESGYANNWSGINTGNNQQISLGYTINSSNRTIDLKIGYMEGSGTAALVTYSIDYDAYDNGDGPALLESLTNVGNITVDFSPVIAGEDVYEDGYGITNIYILSGLCKCANLNVFDNIDWIAFE